MFFHISNFFSKNSNFIILLSACYFHHSWIPKFVKFSMTFLRFVPGLIKYQDFSRNYKISGHPGYWKKETHYWSGEKRREAARSGEKRREAERSGEKRRKAERSGDKRREAERSEEKRREAKRAERSGGKRREAATSGEKRRKAERSGDKRREAANNLWKNWH